MMMMLMMRMMMMCFYWLMVINGLVCNMKHTKHTVSGNNEQVKSESWFTPELKRIIVMRCRFQCKEETQQWQQTVRRFPLLHPHHNKHTFTLTCASETHSYLLAKLRVSLEIVAFWPKTSCRLSPACETRRSSRLAGRVPIRPLTACKGALRSAGVKGHFTTT